MCPPRSPGSAVHCPFSRFKFASQERSRYALKFVSRYLNDGSYRKSIRGTIAGGGSGQTKPSGPKDFAPK